MSAREIHEMILERRDCAYTTTRTNLARMEKKGTVRKRNKHGMNVYTPAVSKVKTLAHQIVDFTDRVVGISAEQIVPLFASSDSLTEKEIKELELLIDRATKKRK